MSTDDRMVESYCLVCFLFLYYIAISSMLIMSPYLSRANVILKKEVACGQQRYTTIDSQCQENYNGFIFSTCYELIVSLSKDESAYERFLMHFDSEDRDFRVRNLRINFSAAYMVNNAEMIDDFLTTRPWWTMKEEIYQDLRTCENKIISHHKNFDCPIYNLIFLTYSSNNIKSYVLFHLFSRILSFYLLTWIWICAGYVSIQNT